MNLTVEFTGLQEKIIQSAVRLGLAKTKSEAIRMALLELNKQYNLLEDLQDLEDIEEQDKLIKEGKMQLVSSDKVKKKFGWK